VVLWDAANRRRWAFCAQLVGVLSSRWLKASSRRIIRPRLYCAKSFRLHVHGPEPGWHVCSAVFELPCQEPHKLAPLISFVFRSNPTKHWRSIKRKRDICYCTSTLMCNALDLFFSPPSISFCCKVGYEFMTYDEGPFCCLPKNVTGSTEKNP
jgi:hypothetical protein